MVKNLNFIVDHYFTALVGFLKPKRILEFGTGGGYSTLCMARALTDFKIDGKIYTVDRVGNDEKISRLYQLSNDKELQKNKISNKEIWKSIAHQANGLTK